MSTELRLRQYRQLWYTPSPSSALYSSTWFAPQTFIVPNEQVGELDGMFIMKPNAGSQGLGIALVHDPEQVAEGLRAAELVVALEVTAFNSDVMALNGLFAARARNR